MTGYGAVENKPQRTVVVGAVVGVLLLAAAIAGIIYYQTSERRKLDAADAPSLEAEHDALRALEPPLERLEAAAVPETPPAEFEKMLAAARELFGRHTAEPRRAGRLPSGRAWPAQFETAERAASEALKKYGLVAIYLREREKVRRSPQADPLAADTNVRNVAEMADEELAKLRSALDAMERQRGEGEWVYQAPR